MQPQCYGPGDLHQEHIMGAMIWDLPIRGSRSVSQAEYEAEEQAYREWCARLIEAEQDLGENDAAQA